MIKRVWCGWIVVIVFIAAAAEAHDDTRIAVETITNVSARLVEGATPCHLPSKQRSPICSPVG